MDFSVIFQLRTKKFWWIDVIFYFTMSLLIAAVFCYFVFLTKNSFQRRDIEKIDVALQTVGTEQQKEYEKDVLDYQEKISGFMSLLENHEFASNVFAFMQTETMPNIWFKQFSLDKKNSSVQLSGEADSMDALSRQVLDFEKNKYVKNITVLNSSLGSSARTDFNISLALEQNIFSYLSIVDLLGTTTPSNQQNQTDIEDQNNPDNNTDITGENQSSENKSNEKLITSFHFILDPEVVGAIDQANHAVTLDVPYGTDIKNLTPSIVVSSGATVLPASYISQDFEMPVNYRVTAEDGSIQDYKVQVNVGAPPINEEGSYSGRTVLIIVIAIIIIFVVVVTILFLKRMSKKNIGGISNI